ncbi:single-stranded DNA-binding protein [Bifidobacterium sp. 82T24]|uniref:single-stranded DNA-binding protein n=1 Tax=Bifidobacterium pluvialisilvae TaxID=2834436 RepID=UPI001C5990CA|nr:single-stranded DNA-binding protein [Bifidobacterium pluvialisilvae]MBW3087988.1 single-stranded DNA-binding protein [Bifidobacterium pluvialisilvae]
MAQQSQIVITGNVGREPTRLGAQGSTPMCTFRLASTRSFWNRRTRQWQESPTTWITVKAFRSLALNVMQSVKKGDAVIVVGDLVTETWERDGAQRSAIAIEAAYIGHDLNRGASMFVRKQYGGGGSGGGDAASEAGGQNAAPVIPGPGAGGAATPPADGPGTAPSGRDPYADIPQSDVPDEEFADIEPPPDDTPTV